MRSLVLLTLVLVLVGCAKKAQFTGGSNDSATITPQPGVPGKTADKNDRKKANAEKPNWLTDPRLKDKDGNQLPVENQPDKPGWGVQPPDGGWTPPNAPAPQPGAVGNPQPKGAVQPQPAAPPAAVTTTSPMNLKPVSEADMKDVWIFIENASGASGKMPASADVLAALLQATSSAAPLVVDGSITVTGAKVRESVWAYETKARTKGGWVATQNGVETMTAAELTRRLGK